MFGKLGSSFGRLGSHYGFVNPISLSGQSIAENSANGTTLGTASVPASYTGTPVWSLTDVSGTFQINSSTGVITVLSNTALNHATNPTIPITISVSGLTPAVPGLPVTVIVTAAVGSVALMADMSNLNANEAWVFW